jgi:hypothetical protein
MMRRQPRAPAAYPEFASTSSPAAARCEPLDVYTGTLPTIRQCNAILAAWEAHNATFNGYEYDGDKKNADFLKKQHQKTMYQYNFRLTW